MTILIMLSFFAAGVVLGLFLRPRGESCEIDGQKYAKWSGWPAWGKVDPPNMGPVPAPEPPDDIRVTDHQCAICGGIGTICRHDMCPPIPPSCPKCRHKNHSIRHAPDGVAYCLECGLRVRPLADEPDVPADLLGWNGKSCFCGKSGHDPIDGGGLDYSGVCGLTVNADRGISISSRDLIGHGLETPGHSCPISVRRDPPSSDTAGVEA